VTFGSRPGHRYAQRVVSGDHVILFRSNKNMLYTFGLNAKLCFIWFMRGVVVRKPAQAGVGRDLVRVCRMHQASDKIEWDANEEAVVIKLAVPHTAYFMGRQRSHERNKC